MKSVNASLGARALDRLRSLVFAYLVIIAVGLGAVALKSRVVLVDSWHVQPSESATRNLAHLTAGTRLSASSYNAVEKGVHPLYAIDGDPTPPLRWVSEPTDRKPWLNFKLAMVANVESIKLEHFPKKTAPKSPRGFTVTCLKRSAGGLETTAMRHFVDDSWSGQRHPIDCKGIDEVRIQFDESQASMDETVGLYEVTLMGNAQ